jgi:hypothetical protein
VVYSRRCKLPHDWDDWKDDHPKDMPLPGGYRVLEWEDFRDRMLEGGVRDYFGHFHRWVSGGFEHPVQTALFGYWAFRRGDPEGAVKLLDLARRSASDYVKHRDNRFSTLAAQAYHAVTKNLRWRAITAANCGAPREDILDRWRLLLEYASYDEESEATRMVTAYESLLKEDAEFVERTLGELAEMPRAEQAEYWLHRLRDHPATQFSQPGMVVVLDPWLEYRGEESAAHRLRDLDWDAIPVLVESLGDERPTRSMGYWRNFALDSFYLLSHGEICLRILVDIAPGFDPPRRSSQQEVKLAAQRWWRGHEKQGEVRHYEDLLANDSAWLRRRGAAGLVRLDCEKHLPRLVELVREHGPDGRPGVFRAIAPHLGASHEKLLDRCLEAKSLGVLSDAAERLWRAVGSDRGAKACLRRLPRANEFEKWALPIYDFEKATIRLLADVGADWAIETECNLLLSEKENLRFRALEGAHRFRDARVLDVLVDTLNDRDWAQSRGYGDRYCDMAARAIVEMTDYGKDLPPEGDTEARDALIEELKAHLRSRKRK